MNERAVAGSARSKLVQEEPPYTDERGRQMAEYGIEVEGKPIGWAAVEYREKENEMCLSSILLYGASKGRGFDKQAYRDIAEMCVEEGMTFTSGDTLSEDSTVVWESFVHDGQAIKREDGKYAMILPEGDSA